MKPNTLFIGQKHKHFSELDSTNSELFRMLKKEVESEGLVVSTDFQLQGKGQRGKVWESERGMNLMISVLLKPSSFNLKEQFVLNMAITLGVRAFFAEKVFDYVTIKWPNDIYVNQKKIAGILLENTVKDARIEYCVAGIGANLNQKDFGALTTATSLKLETGQFWNPQWAIEELCHFLEVYYLRLKADKEAILRLYNGFLFGKKWLTYGYLNNELQAKIISVNSDGKANYQFKDGSLKSLNHGEIVLLNS